MYRPTVRYADVYKNYVDDVFRATKLDRNQVIRLALFVAAHSTEFQNILLQHKTKDVPLPFASWNASDHRQWMEQSPETEKEGRDVNARLQSRKETRIAPEPHRSAGTKKSTERRSGAVLRTESKEIKIRFG
jgi:hypothetical protein